MEFYLVWLLRSIFAPRMDVVIFAVETAILSLGTGSTE
jgi:hypothetical protein